MSAVRIVHGHQWDGPGLYPDLTDDEYHGDPVPSGSLSVTGARKLLPPSCPAIYEHERREPREPSAAMDLGKVAHRVVLGAGADVAVVHADDWRSKVAREARDEAREAGQVPLLLRDYEVVKGMAEALAEHPVAGQIFTPGTGHPEVAAFWQDEETGVWCRARYDWLPEPVKGRRLLACDYKSARSAYPADFGRAAADFGYAQQDEWYRGGLRALGFARPGFVFVTQSKTAPYPVSVVELDGEARRVGSERNARARRIYAACTTAGQWPGYSTEVTSVSLPHWFITQHDEQEDAALDAAVPPTLGRSA